MKIKAVIAVAFFLAISALVFTQAKEIIAAEKIGAAPLSSPISSPMTYMLRGLVRYNVNGTYQPAPNVVIDIRPGSSVVSTSTTTDQTGHYSVVLKEGFYTLTPSDRFHSRFTPVSVTFLLNSNWNQDFTGIMPPALLK